MASLLVTGVGGSGKTTLGLALGDALGTPFVDGDWLHGPNNVEKMRGGQGLTDDDRRPWLDSIRSLVQRSRSPKVDSVIAASLLKRKYREAILEAGPAFFVQLGITRTVVYNRLQDRSGHYFGVNLIDSQFHDLEELGAHEPGCLLDATGSVSDNVALTRAALRDSCLEHPMMVR